ncbi:hypothetical protein MG293_001478 [Ovis ammon polii]|uniref:Uncharacterized protein n=1 Tax=Ovis ammon polii TaxID=230172 RepID=A0AAD4YI66_OVIAM|nr:hypothetical protein MG293_001478 [Ovis ammon polii]
MNKGYEQIIQRRGNLEGYLVYEEMLRFIDSQTFNLKQIVSPVFISTVKVKLLSHVRFFVTPRTVAYQTSQSMGFSRQEYWSGLPFPSPGDPSDPGIEPGSPAL